MRSESLFTGIVRRVEEVVAALVDLALWPLVHATYVDLPELWTADDLETELL